ncbi:thioredoxin family protein [Cellulomonas humilata]|uniref:Thioredoxin family protein n=1 Tax=Cellulomonas humilata TaxID=144055 RepID=A0A7Y6DWU2_9CELL|nr:thioredoxin family protein [Cellulomonas humilata]NUU17003.1 thioredoxin family protein [Cellulomonas humilata]
MDALLRYFDGCPNWRLAEQRLRAALDGTGHGGVAIALERVETEDDAARLSFTGSPTILLDGVDPFGHPTAPAALSCRLYSTRDGLEGLPSVDQLVEVLS